jgi:phosphoribosyl-dephospho-CoA transferase
MAKTRELSNEVDWEMEEIDINEETGPEDYVFVVTPAGGIKAMLLPQEVEGDMSQGIKDLLAFFENQYVEGSVGKTLH